MNPFADTPGPRAGHGPRAVCATVLFASAVVLGACGGGAPAGAPVASLPGSSAPVAPTSTVDQSDRPQLRLDSTDADVAQAWKPYDICLKDHGHKMIAGRGDGNSPAQDDDSDTARAATKACAGKLPLQPPEMEQATNPHFLDDYRNWITCMNTKGVPVAATDPLGSGWTYTAQPALSEAQAGKVEQDCKVGAFSGQ